MKSSVFFSLNIHKRSILAAYGRSCLFQFCAISSHTVKLLATRKSTNPQEKKGVTPSGKLNKASDVHNG